MDESPASDIEGEPQGASPASAAAPSVPAPPLVECGKCRARNSPGVVTCSECGAKLLRGRSLGERAGYLVVGVGGAAALGFVAYRLTAASLAGTDIPELCASPVTVALMALVWLVGGFALALGPTPKYEQYVRRAQRHAEISPLQALADLNTALELAPKKQRAAILKQRSKIYGKLGRNLDALADLSGYAESGNAHGVASISAELTGLPIDAMAEGWAEGATRAEIHALQDRLVSDGTLAAIGWCGHCKEVVALDQQRRCSVCGRKVKQPRHVRPEAREVETQRIRDERSARRRKRLMRLAVVAVLLAGGTAVCATTDAWPLKPRTVTTTPAPPAIATIGTTTFDGEWVSFEVPSNWQKITDAEVRDLLRSSLQGLRANQYRSIGGVYFGGVDGCSDCATIVVVVLTDPAFEGVFGDEQYEGVRGSAQQSMGTRLISHRQTMLAGLPGAESIYIGKSERTQNWDVFVVPPEPGLAYMVACSAQKGDYERFEPVFARVFETLRFAGVAAGPAPTATPTNTAEPTAAPTPDLSGCHLDSLFQADVTVPDNTPFSPGEPFTKTWRIRNVGSCPWDAGYHFSFVEGDRMDAPDWVEVPHTAPGADAELSVVLTAPAEPGRYRAVWQICAAGGECFGDRITVVIRAVEP